MYICMCVALHLHDVYVMYIVNSVKEKNGSEEPVKYTDVAAEDTSIKEFPTDVSYATTDKAFNGNTNSKPTPQYDYARTGARKVKNIYKFVRTSQTLSYVATYLYIMISLYMFLLQYMYVSSDFLVCYGSPNC